MKKYLFLTLFMLVALLVKAQDENGEIVKVGDQMPSFTIVNDNGTKIAGREQKGKISYEYDQNQCRQNADGCAPRCQRSGT
jgi:hypothetical protein